MRWKGRCHCDWTRLGTRRAGVRSHRIDRTFPAGRRGRRPGVLSSAGVCCASEHDERHNTPAAPGLDHDAELADYDHDDGAACARGRLLGDVDGFTGRPDDGFTGDGPRGLRRNVRPGGGRGGRISRGRRDGAPAMSEARLIIGDSLAVTSPWPSREQARRPHRL